MIAMKQSGELLAWIVDLFKKDGNRFMIADSDLNPCEKLIRHGAIVGVEEDFVLPYRLPKPVDINGTVHSRIGRPSSGYKKQERNSSLCHRLEIRE